MAEGLHRDLAASPDIPTLIRMWLACATPDQLREEYDEAMRDLCKEEPAEEKEGSP